MPKISTVLPNTTPNIGTIVLVPSAFEDPNFLSLGSTFTDSSFPDLALRLRGKYDNTDTISLGGTLPVATTWATVAWNGSVFCAIAGMGAASDVAATSPDGITWTQRTMPAAVNWTSVAWNGSVFCAVAQVTSIAATSPDGITWTQRTMPSSSRWSDIVWNGRVFCAVAGHDGDDNAVATSPDGITWTAGVMPTSTIWSSIAWNGSVFSAVAGGRLTNASRSIAATSPDGVTWTQRTLPSSQNWTAVTSNGSTFCTVAGGGGGGTTLAATSPDGITWTPRTLPLGQWFSVHSNGFVFFAVTRDSTVSASSPDGITWTQGTLPTNVRWTNITHSNERFLVVGGANLNVDATAVTDVPPAGQTRIPASVSNGPFGTHKYVIKASN